MAMDVSGERVSLKIYDANTPEISFYYIYLYKQVSYIFTNGWDYCKIYKEDY